MNHNTNLKEIERRAFSSTFQDGLWDLYFGVIVIGMALFLFRADEGYGPRNIFYLSGIFLVAFLLFLAGKKFITAPRLGQVTFGPQRRKKSKILAIILAIVITLQAMFILVGVLGWLKPEFSAKISALLGGRSLERLPVATVASLFVGPSMILVAYFSDFLRGYYIAILMSMAVFLMILFNHPLIACVIGGLIALPGLVIFIRFLKQYPRRDREASSHE